jgi:hypothetical protein
VISGYLEVLVRSMLWQGKTEDILALQPAVDGDGVSVGQFQESMDDGGQIARGLRALRHA